MKPYMLRLELRRSGQEPGDPPLAAMSYALDSILGDGIPEAIRAVTPRFLGAVDRAIATRLGEPTEPAEPGDPLTFPD